MSKLSSKLAAGVRQVKSERGAAPASQGTVEGRRQSATERKQHDPAESRSELHPARVWPD
jgi:hypothetical protein